MFLRALFFLICTLSSAVHLHSTDTKYYEKKMPLQKHSYDDFKLWLPITWVVIPEQEMKKYKLEYGEANANGAVSWQTAYSNGFTTRHGAELGIPALCLIHRLNWNSGKSADSFVKILLQDLKTKGQGRFKILEKGTTKLDHKKAEWFICAHEYNGQKYKNISYVLTTKKHLYYLNYSSELINFSEMEKTFKRAVKSFTVK